MKGVKSMTLNGVAVEGAIPIQAAGTEHEVRVVMGV